MKNKRRSAPPAASIAYFPIVALGSILLVIIALISLSVLLQGNARTTLFSPARWLGAIDQSVAFEIVSNAAELLAAVLAIAITVIAIVVELAANRYSHRITSLFVKEPINIVVMSFFVVATAYCVWIAITFGTAAEQPVFLNAGLLGSLVMVTISLVILLPYFAFVMSFLSPVSVIGKIQKSALKAIADAKVLPSPDCQLRFLNAIDEIQDIARRSSEQSDRAVEMASINAMLELTLDYQKMLTELERLAPNWFVLGESVESDPDFISISKVSLDQICQEKLWVEVKILRQYLDLVSDSNPGSRDTSYLIAINTKRIAVDSLAYRPNLELVNLCLRCFNSYLRATINAKDARTGYYVMNQYCMLAEELSKAGQYEALADIAGYLQYYGLLAFSVNLPFLLEVAAEDIAQLTGQCIDRDVATLDRLLALLLDLDQGIRNENQEKSLLGVRRAQLKLAALFMECGDEMRALRICEDFKGETRERKEHLFRMLQSENRREYWEFTDRGVNFAYLSPEHKRHLDFLAGQSA